jgi:hypothetical protein
VSGGPLIPRAFFRAFLFTLRRQSGRFDGRAAAVASLQTAGNLLHWHPHCHALLPLGLFLPDGSFLPVPHVDTAALEQRFRINLLRLLLHARAIRPETAQAFLSWDNSGFHAFLGHPIPPGDAPALEKIAAYILRPPLSLSRIRFAPDGHVLYCADKVNPNFNADHRLFDPLDFIAEATQHIPDPYRNSTLFYGAYSPRALGEQKKRSAGGATASHAAAPCRPSAPRESDSEFLRRRRMLWAQCIRKIYLQDPLKCPSDGATMKIVSFLSDPQVIAKILKAVGFEDPLPPPLFPSPKLEALRQGCLDVSRTVNALHPFPDATPGLQIATPLFSLTAQQTADLLPDDGGDFLPQDAADSLPDDDFFHLDAPAPDTFDIGLWPEGFDSS